MDIQSATNFQNRFYSEALVSFPVSGWPGGWVPLNPGSSGLPADSAGSSHSSHPAEGAVKESSEEHPNGAKNGLMTPSTKAE